MRKSRQNIEIAFFNSLLMYYVRVYSYLFKLKEGRLIQIPTVSISVKITDMIDTHLVESILYFTPRKENCTKYVNHFGTVCKKYWYLKYWLYQYSIYLVLDPHQILQYRLHLVQICYFFCKNAQRNIDKSRAKLLFTTLCCSNVNYSA